jgi:hypothetical protein
LENQLRNAQLPDKDIIKILNLRSRILCPHCWDTFPPENVYWISQHASLRGDLFLGADAQQRFLPSRFNLQGNAIDSGGQICHDLACPACHLTIARAMLELPSLMFSIVGTPSCGKSYFLASMTWQLRRTLPERFAISFADADPDSNRILNYYEEQQFYNPNGTAVVKLAKTEEFGDLYDTVLKGEQRINYPRPFMFTVRPLERHPRAAQAEQISQVICLYDNAGESFAPGRDTAENPVTRHLARADALFFIFDPTQDPRFRQACGNHTNDPQVRQALVTARQETTLHEMASRVRRYAGIAQQQRHREPLIVVVTKYDTWQGVAPELKLTPPYRFADNKGVFELDLPLIERTSKAVRQLLVKYTPELVSAAEGFAEQVLFIPVSSTGNSPVRDEQTGNWGMRPKDIHPQWVEVPMLWAMTHKNRGLMPAAAPKKPQAPNL